MFRFKAQGFSDSLHIYELMHALKFLVTTCRKKKATRDFFRRRGDRVIPPPTMTAMTTSTKVSTPHAITRIATVTSTAIRMRSWTPVRSQMATSRMTKTVMTPSARPTPRGKRSASTTSMRTATVSTLETVRSVSTVH